MFFKQKILNQRNVILQKTLHNQAVAITASLVSFLFSSSWFCSQAFTTFKMTDMKTVGSIMFNLRCDSQRNLHTAVQILLEPSFPSVVPCHGPSNI